MTDPLWFLVQSAHVPKARFTFVVATSQPQDGQLPLPLRHLNTHIRIPSDIHVDALVFYGNKDGLPMIYNRAIDEARGSDFVVFVHDDVTLNDCLFFDKVIESKFDVIGAVGGLCWCIPKDFPIQTRPLIWTVATGGRGASGFMNHDLKQEGQHLPSSYGVSPARTATLDGSIIIFTRKAMDKGLRWDERFNFHFYDIDVCFTAHHMGLTVGTANLLLTHGSIGASVAQPEFMEAQKKFLEKFLKKV